MEDYKPCNVLFFSSAVVFEPLVGISLCWVIYNYAWHYYDGEERYLSLATPLDDLTFNKSSTNMG